jgi:hypothetical protein
LSPGIDRVGHTCLKVGHMSQSEAHVTKWVACHKTGHMSLMLWQIEPKSSCVPPYMGLNRLNFTFPSFRTDILCHAQQSNITPKPLLCVGMKAFFCFDVFTFVSLPSPCSKPTPPLCGNPPARAQARVGAGVPSLRARHRPELRPQIDFSGSVSLVL